MTSDTATCVRCGARLSRFNGGARICAPCEASLLATEGIGAERKRRTSGPAWLRSPSADVISPPRARLGQVLREYRAARGMTQEQLANRLGFDQSYMSKVESGTREIREVEGLWRIAEQLEIAPHDLGLTAPVVTGEQAPMGERGRNGSSGLDGAEPLDVLASHRHWRMVRRYLNRHRLELTDLAAGLYPDVPRVERTPLLVRPDWAFPEPVDLASIRLDWSDEEVAPGVTGAEREADPLRPICSGDVRYSRYTRAIRDLDRPTLFENRASYRLLGVDVGPTDGRLDFAHTTYFDMVDVCEAVAHELAGAAMAPRPVDGGAADGLPALPFRELVGDPFDLTRRALLPSIDTLTVRRDGDSATIVLHRRDPAQVAVAGGMFHIMPAGVFQPSSLAPEDRRNDFDLWRNVMREYAEEFLGDTEQDGSAGVPIDYDRVEPFRSLNAARRRGQVRPWCFGIGLDPLTLAGEILTAVVIDAEVYDELFRDMVTVNNEGAVITETAGGGSAKGIRFDEANIERLLRSEPMAPAAAACVALAWRHRELLLAD